MVIRHPLVEDHYKNITPQTSTTNFLLSSVLPNQSTSNLKLEKNGEEFEILIFILNSSTFCTIYIPPVIKQH